MSDIDWALCHDCKEVLPLDYKYETCCGGHECGCMGMPTEIPFCDKCVDKDLQARANKATEQG